MSGMLKKIHEFEWKGEQMVLLEGSYQNGRRFLRVNTEAGEPYATITTNLPEDQVPVEEGTFLVALYNLSEMGRWLLTESGWFRDTGKRWGTQFLDDAFAVFTDGMSDRQFMMRVLEIALGECQDYTLPVDDVVLDTETVTQAQKHLAEGCGCATGLWYFSYAGREGFLGATIIRANGYITASQKSHKLKINPGGQALGGPVSPQAADRIPDEMIHRLLSLEDVKDLETLLKPLEES